MKLFFIFFAILALAIADNSVITEFNNGNKLFTADVYDDLQTDNNGNFVFSPYSIETLLALIQSGAEGTTGEEIRSVLHFPSTREDTEEAMKYTIPAVYGDFGTIATLNRINVDGSFSISEDFKQTATNVYEVQFGSFKERVKNFTSLAAANKISFVNDLSMIGDWASKFDYSSTSRTPFYPDANIDNPVNVNMMNTQLLDCNYYENEELDAKILELPLKEDGISLTIILPNEILGLDDLEKQVDKVFETPEFAKEAVDIYLPRFVIDSTINFGGVLKNLGLENIFVFSEADLSAIGGEKGDLYISQIQQNVRIDIHESSVGGDADATIDAYKIATTSTKTFLADHPFIFYVKIRDVIVLAGRVIQPRS